MPATKLKEFLDSRKIKYATISHPPAYTAEEIAQEAHIPGKQMAKTVMVKVDGKMAMAVVPAHHKVDFFLLKQVADAEHVALAHEREFKNRFPDCDVGAMPPFGNLYDMDVYVEEALSWDDEIGFSAGTHSEVIKLAFKDFENLVHPKVAHF
ncbi:MAG: deacylase [Nitrospinaceae bacterium]|nr:YbaK/EbsC family protein [Nitrospinaceae bacterium]NIR56274.1 YbaK/EbsC family protein [Nitrospinaceae bacterium]NIS86731.1 YbaK/EbsC family protein [Nitrospinaceae bacterium]NIT83563.1 YbaK/EbsC family protein [Nitrospinaceae bacterium]NIU45768.1 YbaK/EbsC family protein [Nitrospinaceae bacterium]